MCWKLELLLALSPDKPGLDWDERAHCSAEQRIRPCPGAPASLPQEGQQIDFTSSTTTIFGTGREFSKLFNCGQDYALPGRVPPLFWELLYGEEGHRGSAQTPGVRQKPLDQAVSLSPYQGLQGSGILLTITPTVLLQSCYAGRPMSCMAGPRYASRCQFACK